MAYDRIKAIQEDLTIHVGMGATLSCGSDRYPYYVSERLPNNVIGLYRPGYHFTNDWTDGDMTVDEFDSNAKSTLYIKRRYGKWWAVRRDGTPLRRFTSRYERLSFGSAIAYRDPSF